MALLFPGQGSQHPGMLHALPDGPAVRAARDQARAELQGLGVGAGDRLDTAAGLRHGVNTQLALLIAGVAAARWLIEDQHVTPRFVVGHSIGAWAAAVTAKVLTFAEALAGVLLRARLMDRACAGGDWGMAAVTGLPVRAAWELAEKHGTTTDPLWLANVNSATQTVFSGTRAALHTLAGAAAAAGARAVEDLEVTVASHCPLQDDTAARLSEHLADVPRREPTLRYLTNTGGRAVDTAERVLADLAASVARPVQFHDAARLLPELGATAAVELPPRDVLTRLIGASAPGISAVALDGPGATAALTRIRRAL